MNYEEALTVALQIKQKLNAIYGVRDDPYLKEPNRLGKFLLEETIRHGYMQYDKKKKTYSRTGKIK